MRSGYQQQEQLAYKKLNFQLHAAESGESRGAFWG